MNEKITKCTNPVGAIIDRPTSIGNTLKKENGITLIALVITIIILLILAGVTLNIVFNGGLMEKSQEAVDTYSEEQARESLMLAIVNHKFSQYTKETENFEDCVAAEGGTAKHNEAEKTYTVNIKGYEFTVDEETWEILGGNKGTVQTPVTPQEPVTPTPPTTVGKDNTEGTTHTKIGSGDYAYNNPVIPAGFETVETDLASWADANNDGIVDGWNNGLVIQDGSGNQFVWVPAQIVAEGETAVSGVVEYKKWCTTNIAYNHSSITGDDLPSGVTEETQIETYGGFYIGRYEASEPSSGTVPQTQYNKLTWTSTNYTNSKTYAESYKNNGNVKSGLLTGTMWDTALAWIDTNVTGYSTSTNKGNYSGSKANTGKTTSDFVNNICDLAGNVREWTAEQYSTDRVRRGGYYGNSDAPAYRDNFIVTNTDSYYRF